MSPLRQRLQDALVLRGMAQRSQDSYINAVARLSRHYRRSPDLLSAEEVQGYLLHLLKERCLARSSVNVYGCAYRFFYGTVLGRDGDAFQIPLGAAPQKLPEILSRDELARLFAAARHVKSRTFLMLAYSTGLRVSELCSLGAAHIDSASDRMCIRVVQGKGAKDRYVPLTAEALQLLRDWWPLSSSRKWIFAAAGDSSQPMSTINGVIVFFVQIVTLSARKRSSLKHLQNILRACHLCFNPWRQSRRLPVCGQASEGRWATTVSICTKNTITP